MWIIRVSYKKPLEEVSRWLEEHRSFLDEHYARKNLLASGPLVPRTGGIILARRMPKEELLALIAEDPFHREGVAEYDLTEFHVTKGISSLIEPQ